MLQIKNNGKNLIFKIRLFLICFFLLWANAFALTWQEAKQSLVNNNIALNQSVENIYIAKNDLSITRSQLNPIVSLRGGAERFLQEDASLGFRSFLGPRLTWSLYQGGRIKNSAKQAKFNLRKQTTQSKLTKIEQESQLRQAFANAVFAKRNIVLAKTAIQRAQNNNRYVRLRYKGGQEYVWVFQSSQKTILETEANLLKAEQEAKLALFSLQQIIGQESLKSLEEVSEDSFDLPGELNEINTQNYLDQHPKLQVSKYNTNIADAGYRIARSNRRPSLLFRTDFIVADTDDSQVFPFWYAGINFSMPLFESGRYKKASRNAKLKLKQANDLYVQAKQKQGQDIQQQILGYQWARKSLDVAKINLESMRNKYKLLQKQYREGLAPYAQWDRAQEELRFAERQWIQSMQLLHVEYAKLLLVLGVTEDEFKAS